MHKLHKLLEKFYRQPTSELDRQQGMAQKNVCTLHIVITMGHVTALIPVSKTPIICGKFQVCYKNSEHVPKSPPPNTHTHISMACLLLEASDMLAQFVACDGWMAAMFICRPAFHCLHTYIHTLSAFVKKKKKGAGTHIPLTFYYKN
jgi:hypothetical protein